ncbi:hypothetical protein MHZ92_08810 [Sporosarcina sp. ACRSL]|uniref:hypothetical protein n=1 Tax=Sporosarcina sp. ACRSL TaxID=2918215 RepID=UPI001EF663B9|nr:hypothetical protein [Sporosarcina sp. ACRSL]MCG7344232.1 hypothetical protein [Sporosarcina sp. ACRSL]
MEVSASKQNEQPLLKKVPIWLMILLSVLSLGFYLGFWLLNRKRDLNALQSTNHIPFTLWTISTVLLIVFFFLNTFNHFIFSNIGYLYVESMDTIFTFFFIGLLYYSAFRIRELIEETSTITFNKYLLFFFHIFYIQYKVNQNTAAKA